MGLLAAFSSFVRILNGWYLVQCPDGRPRWVHRDANHVVSLALRNTEATKTAAIKASHYVQVRGGARTKSTVQDLLFRITAINSGSQLQLHNAYVAFQTDPCAPTNPYTDAVEEIRRTEHALLTSTIILTQAQSLLAEANSLGISASEIGSIDRFILRAISALDGNHPTLSPTPASPMERVRSNTKEWRDL